MAYVIRLQLGFVRWAFIFIYICIGVTGVKRNWKISRVEQQLMNNLLANVSQIARPVSRNDLPVVVDFEAKLGKLVQLNIKDQVMVGSYQVLMRWYNPHLKWNKNDYNGTDYINLPSKLIWTPDIMLYNTALRASQGPGDIYKTHIIIKNTGVAIWMSPVTLEVSCSMNLRWFPFDTQECELEFGSRSYTKKKLKLRFFREIPSGSEITKKTHYSSGHWTMKGMDAYLAEKYFECCDDQFSIIKYKFKWRRLTMYWLLYLVFPCLFLSFLALFSFFIPAETGERTGFGITVVLSMSVYLLVISDKLPEKSDESPVIGVLYTTLFFITSGALLSVIITTHLAFKTTKPSEWLKKYLGLTNKRVVPAQSYGRKILESSSEVVEAGHDIKGYSATELKDYMEEDVEVIELRKREKDGVASVTSKEDDQQQVQNSCQEEWKVISQKVDRILFWLFLSFTCFVLSVVLISYFA